MILDRHTHSVISEDDRGKVPAHSLMGFPP